MWKRLTKHPYSVSQNRTFEQFRSWNFQSQMRQNETVWFDFKIENDVQQSTTTKSSQDESSSNEEDSEEEEEDSLGKTLTKAGKEIDRKSAGNVKRSKEEARADEEPENEFGYTDSE